MGNLWDAEAATIHFLKSIGSPNFLEDAGSLYLAVAAFPRDDMPGDVVMETLYRPLSIAGTFLSQIYGVNRIFLQNQGDFSMWQPYLTVEAPLFSLSKTIGFTKSNL